MTATRFRTADAAWEYSQRTRSISQCAGNVVQLSVTRFAGNVKTQTWVPTRQINAASAGNALRAWLRLEVFTRRQVDLVRERQQMRARRHQREHGEERAAEIGSR
jgi:hypothetical protein